MSKARFAVITDLHYFSPSLTDGGRAYTLRSDSDQKMLAESGSIIESAFKTLSADETIDSVIIPGDLTNDGEMQSHREIREWLDKLSKYKKVFVTYATHDWCCDGNARVYFGDKPEPMSDTASIKDLRDMYDGFGVKDAIAVYETENGEASYVAKLCDGFRIFGLNDDKDGNGRSGFSQEHLEWITEQMKEAKEAGDRIIVMQHHVVLSHYTPLLTKGGICCANREKVAETFASNGAELLFVGHSHMQNITEYRAENGNRLIQMNVASLCGYPAPIVKVNIDDEYINIHTEYVKDFAYGGKRMTGDDIYYHSRGLIENLINSASSGDKRDFTERLASYGVNAPIVEKLYFAVKRLAAYVKSVTVGKLSKTVNCLTFGRGITKSAAEAIADKIVIELVYDIFLNLFDGGFHRYKKGSPTYTVVMDFVSLPLKTIGRIPFVPQKIKELLSEITVLVGMLMDDGSNNSYLRVRTENKEQIPLTKI